MSTPLILIAGSGLAREVMTCLESSSRYEVVGIIDDSPALQGTLIGRGPVLGPIESVLGHPSAKLLLCAGKGAVRVAMAERLRMLGINQDRYATVVDPSARLGSSCSVGAGSIVLAGVVMTSDVMVGNHVVMMPNVTLTHDDRVADFATLCAGVTLGGTVHVGRAAYLGMNSCVRENLAVGPGATLGMGSTLIDDLPSGQTWVGTPAGPTDSSRRPESNPGESSLGKLRT